MPDHQLLSALADLLWPLLAFAAVVALRRPIRALVDSVGSRGGGIEVGGFKVTVSEATAQQQTQISDLQDQVAKLQGVVERLGKEPSAASFGPLIDLYSSTENAPGATRTILWVDDHPENNALLQASLGQQGFDIVNASSTEQALLLFERRAFDAIVSDMGRGRHRDAGIDLTQRIRSGGSELPIFIYSSAGAARSYGSAAVAAGASGITSSPTELLRFLQATADAER